MKDIELSEIVKKILEYKGIKDAPFRRAKSGFNRSVFDIDNRYVLKICTNQNEEKEKDVLNEIDFFLNNDYDFAPFLITYDTSKMIVPYYYTIEEKIMGESLLYRWGNMTNKQRNETLEKLATILKKIHSKPDTTHFNALMLIDKFNNELNTCIEKHIFTSEQIDYLKRLRDSFVYYLNGARTAYIHGDVHFDNVIVSEDKLRLIDFEWYGVDILDREFDAINRMSNNPNSFVKCGKVNEEDFKHVMDMLSDYYPEVMKGEMFEDRLIIFDIYNAIKWISLYPSHERYHRVLFDESKKLIRKQ